MDERKGRLLAQQHGQHVTGVLGLLVWAKEHGQIESVTNEMEQLVTQAHFFIHPSLQAFVRSQVGEG